MMKEEKEIIVFIGVYVPEGEDGWIADSLENDDMVCIRNFVTI